MERLQQERAKGDRDEVLISDIEAALQFTEEDYAKTIYEVKTQTEEGRISYNLLWALLSPNSLVFRRESFVEQDQILRVRKVDYGQSSNGARFASIKCDVIRDDGESFGLAYESLTIDEFPGMRQIRDLDVYPLNMHPESAAIMDQAVARARRFLHVKQTLFETHGSAIREKENTAFETKLEKFFVSVHTSRIILLPFEIKVVCRLTAVS